jgi:DNA polymerase III delta subunit
VLKGAEYYEQRNRQQQIEFVRKKAAQLGLQVTPSLINALIWKSEVILHINPTRKKKLAHSGHI